MGLDYFVAFPCLPRKIFGDGNIAGGGARIVEMLKARNIAALLEGFAERDGKPLHEMTLQRVRFGPGGPREVETTHAELAAECKPLDEQVSHCKGCPANFRGVAYGCNGWVSYPVEERSETWLVDRAEPLGTVGGELARKMIADFGYDGAPIRRLRDRKGDAIPLFAARTAPSRVLEKGFFSSTKVSSDQIWQAIMSVGPELEPAHCMMMLVWLGALRVDGQALGAPQTGGALLMRLSDFTAGEERTKRTSLDVGPPADDPEIRSMQELLMGLYTAYVMDTPLAVDG